MKTNYFRLNSPKRHLIIWILLIIYVAISQIVQGSLISKLLYPLLIILNYVGPYYFLLIYVLPKFIGINMLRLTLFFIITIFCFITTEYATIKVLLPQLGGYRPRIDSTVNDFIKTSLLHFSYLVIPCAGSFLNWKVQIQERERFAKEKSIVEAELDFFANQFHSHLTFNFFSFCYRKLLITSTIAADSVEKFSDMLHYSLKMKQDQKILLLHEIEYIENFIDIQRCINEKVCVNFKYDINLLDYEILPGFLSVFVENAFKHGVFDDFKNPIEIIMTESNHLLVFKVTNKIVNENVFEPSGVDIINIRQVLEIFYQNSYSLHISCFDCIYISELKLQLASREINN